MPRKPLFAAASASRIPQLRHHRPSGRAVVTLNGRDVYVGAWDTKAAKLEYDRVIELWLANGRRLDADDLRVAELVERYLEFAREYYRTDRSTGEFDPINRVASDLVNMFGYERVADFGPLKLKALRQRWIDDGKVRDQINKSVHRARRMFRWGVENELVASGVLNALKAVAGLRQGKTAAPESVPIAPVEIADVEAVLPFLPPPVKAMVELQRYTGMRPGEVVQMTAAAIDQSGALWKFTPFHHKTRHLGKRRSIFLGRICQSVLKPFLDGRDPNAPIFSPKESLEAVRKKRTANRLTPLSCGNRARAIPFRHKLSAGYTPDTYGRAVRRACRLAGVPVWSPNRLRHTFATAVRRDYGIEAAQVLLGHSRADVTQIYALRDEAKAMAVASEVG